MVLIMSQNYRSIRSTGLIAVTVKTDLCHESSVISLRASVPSHFNAKFAREMHAKNARLNRECKSYCGLGLKLGLPIETVLGNWYVGIRHDSKFSKDQIHTN